LTPKTWLRLEGGFGFISCTIIYFYLGLNIYIFLACLFLPDIFMLGYLINSKVGAFIYNIGHVFIFPLILFMLAVITTKKVFLAMALIWAAHIFLDRMLGYGLKYKEGFKITHLHKLDD